MIGLLSFKGKDKWSSVEEIRVLLESMQNQITSIHALRVGINNSSRNIASDLILEVDFKNKKALMQYLEHPYHQEVLSKLKNYDLEYNLVDYEMN